MDTFKNYNLERVIGQGAFSKVIICSHKATGDKAAIKVVDRRKLCGEEELRCIEREMLITPLLRHPNIVRTNQVLEIGRYTQFYMEYCPNGDLLGHVTKSPGGRLCEAEARKLFVGILGAVDYLHRNGFVHRDIKLENVLLNEQLEPKLADFGFCTQYKVYRFAMLTEYCGTISYSSPEICGGIPYVGPEVDIWSLGVSLYAMVAGSLPFSGPDGPTVQSRIQQAQLHYPPSFSRPLVELLKAIFQLDGNRRPTTRKILEFPWFTEVEEADELRATFEKNKSLAKDNERAKESKDDTPRGLNSRRNNSFEREAEPRSKSWGNLPDMNSELLLDFSTSPTLHIFGNHAVTAEKKTSPQTKTSPSEEKKEPSLTAGIMDRLGHSVTGMRKVSIGERSHLAKTVEENDKEGGGEPVRSPTGGSKDAHNLSSSAPSPPQKKPKSVSTIVRRHSFFSMDNNNAVKEEKETEEPVPVTSRRRSNSVDARPEEAKHSSSPQPFLGKSSTVLRLKVYDPSEPEPLPREKKEGRPRSKTEDYRDEKGTSSFSQDFWGIWKPGKEETTKKEKKKGSKISFTAVPERLRTDSQNHSARSRPKSLTLGSPTKEEKAPTHISPVKLPSSRSYIGGRPLNNTRGTDSSDIPSISYISCIIAPSLGSSTSSCGSSSSGSSSSSSSSSSSESSGSLGSWIDRSGIPASIHSGSPAVGALNTPSDYHHKETSKTGTPSSSPDVGHKDSKRERLKERMRTSSHPEKKSISQWIKQNIF